MATSATDPDQLDRLSDLSDNLLLVILSFLPTRVAARTSVLSRRFRHLWEASPSLELLSWGLPHPQSNSFVAMANRALLRRNPSLLLISLRLDIRWCCSISETAGASFVSSLLSKAKSLGLRHLTSLLSKAKSLGLRHLTIEEVSDSWFISVLPLIFSITTLNSLSLARLPVPSPFEQFVFPSGTMLTSLRSLSLTLFSTDTVKLNQLLSELSFLQDLHLNAILMHGLNLVSKTIRKLKLVISNRFRELDTVELFLPSLQTFQLDLCDIATRVSGDVPLLAKAIIDLDALYDEDVRTIANLLNFISNVEVLSLRMKELVDANNPAHILFEPKKGMPNFPNLKHLDVAACLHMHNLEAVTTMLHHSPVLESLNLVHEVPAFDYRATERKKKEWRSKLPRNADGNCHYAHFRNLSLGENRKEFMKWMSHE